MRWMLGLSGQRVLRHTLDERHADMLYGQRRWGFGKSMVSLHPRSAHAPTPPGLISTLTLLQYPARPTWGFCTRPGLCLEVPADVFMTFPIPVFCGGLNVHLRPARSSQLRRGCPLTLCAASSISLHLLVTAAPRPHRSV